MTGVSVLGAVPAAAAPATWYAYPSGTSSSTTSCPETAVTTSECSLTQALSDALAGDTVALATSGIEGNTSTYYIGNFTVSLGTSASPLTIEAASGVTDPILDGNNGSSNGCSTTSCDGSVLSIGSGVYATIESITIQHANNMATNIGGVLSNGNATLTDDTFSGDNAQFGGGIYVNSGTATLNDDTFSGDSAEYGGGIYVNSGTATLNDDTFSGDTASAAGGGVLNSGTATLNDDTFSGDTAPDGGGVRSISTTTISNSILDAAPCEGSITDGSYNVESDDTCGFGGDDLVNSLTIHLASSLAPNGSTGPETLAIGTDSSAYQEVPAANCTISTDERGDPRPGFPGNSCDAGAFEYGQPTTPTISNLPASGTYGGGFTATVSTNGDGTKSVTSNSPSVCSASALVVSYVGVGTCSLTAHVAAGTDYGAADGSAQTFSVGQAATKTALKLSATKVTYGHEQTERLSVTVSPQYPGTTPTRTVTVKTSTKTLCVITLSSGKGSCALSAKRLKVGTHHLVATYGGSTNFKGSTSADKTLSIVK
ncbi:MAG TPA: Ig-like domain-containing protein [Acidimicrobiales bacterium]|nr:Ig-like domain-containing protein [Acidimicrobiales bacterium]